MEDSKATSRWEGSVVRPWSTILRLVAGPLDSLVSSDLLHSQRVASSPPAITVVPVASILPVLRFLCRNYSVQWLSLAPVDGGLQTCFFLSCIIFLSPRAFASFISPVLLRPGKKRMGPLRGRGEAAEGVLEGACCVHCVKESVKEID